ncbi:MAG TPA: thioredoxin family protein [Blastocatellia bacterium]
MRQFSTLIFCVVIFLISVNSQGQETSRSKYVPVTIYDPKRDAASDIQKAVLEAQRAGKRVLVDVGGEWCSWCHILDRFFEQNPSLLEYREQNFVMVKINFSRENENQTLLSRYPKIPGFPHLFVLDAKGNLLRSQDTSELEEGRSYNLGKMFDFLRKWAVNK